MQCVYGAELDREPERLARLADLVADPRWAATFKLIATAPLPGKHAPPLPNGRIAAKQLTSTVQRTLAGPFTNYLELAVARDPAADTARVYLNLGRFGARAWANALWTPPDSETEAVTARWIELQHALVEALGAQHAVIVAAPSRDLARIEVWLQNIKVDGRPVHPDPDEISSYAVNAWKLGDEYVRAPRWGTYLSRKHLDAIGGAARVVDEVKPAVVRDVGALTYFQLCERLADALAPETHAKQQAFEALVAPLLPP